MWNRAPCKKALPSFIIKKKTHTINLAGGFLPLHVQKAEGRMRKHMNPVHAMPMNTSTAPTGGEGTLSPATALAKPARCWAPCMSGQLSLPVLRAWSRKPQSPSAAAGKGCHAGLCMAERRNDPCCTQLSPGQRSPPSRPENTGATQRHLAGG